MTFGWPLHNFPHQHFFFLIWFNYFNFIAPNCRKFIKFLLKKLNLVFWYHTTTILKGDLNYHLIRKFLDNFNKLYNNSININLSQKSEYISNNFIISKLMTVKKKKKICHISLCLSVTFSFSSIIISNETQKIYIIFNFNKI